MINFWSMENETRKRLLRYFCITISLNYLLRLWNYPHKLYSCLQFALFRTNSKFCFSIRYSLHSQATSVHSFNTCYQMGRDLLLHLLLLLVLQIYELLPHPLSFQIIIKLIIMISVDNNLNLLDNYAELFWPFRFNFYCC